MNMDTDNPIANYEAQLTQLEQIVTAMESGELPLEAALNKYEEGIALIRRCQAVLSQAEQKIHILTRNQSDHETLEPMEENTL